MFKKILSFIICVLFSFNALAATYYIDPENGDDANDGSTWALAWETITNGATFARLAAGDEILIAKSPDPTLVCEDAVWTDESKAITVAGLSWYSLHDCESVTDWTVGASGTSRTTNSSYEKEGTYCISFDTSDASSGIIAYYTFSSAIDLSSYQRVSFWFRADDPWDEDYGLQLNLCSDTAGATPVVSVTIDKWLDDDQWIPIAYDNGSALPSSIQSISLTCTTDMNADEFYLDNIFVSPANGVTLQSLISKNSTATGVNDPWYAVQSITGTTLNIDQDPDSALSGDTDRGYTGTSETADMYARDTFISERYNDISINHSGTSGSLVSFKGGYNTSTSLQDGLTFFDQLETSESKGLCFQSDSYVSVENICLVRCEQAVYLYNADNITVNLPFVVSCDYALYTYNLFENEIINFSSDHLTNCSTGLYLAYIHNSNFNIGKIYGTMLYPIQMYSSGYYVSDLNFGDLVIDNSLDSRIYAGTNINFDSLASSSDIDFCAGNSTINSLSMSGGAYFRNYGGNVLIKNYVSSDSYNASAPSGQIKWKKTSDGTYNISTYNGVVTSETSTRHTASGLAWKLDPDSDTTSDMPHKFKIATISCVASELTTVTAYMQRSSNSTIDGRLICPGGQISGVDSDVSDSITAASSTWEQLTISFTPTEDGYVDIYAAAYGSSGYVYVDDMTVSLASTEPDLKTMDYIVQGEPNVTNYVTGGGGGGGVEQVSLSWK